MENDRTPPRAPPAYHAPSIVGRVSHVNVIAPPHISQGGLMPKYWR